MGMPQEPTNRITKIGARIPHTTLVHTSSKVSCIFLDGLCSGFCVLIKDDVVPRDGVKVMDAATGANQENSLLAK
jgi:hypothetical protein